MFNQEKCIDIIDFKKEEKRRQRKEKFQRKVDSVKCWTYNNKESVAILTSVLIGGMTASIKVVNKHVKLKKEKDLKELYCYDRSLGHYWKLRRALSNSEWIKIDKRKQNGERLSDILEEMKVLK